MTRLDFSAHSAPCLLSSPLLSFTEKMCISLFCLCSRLQSVHAQLVVADSATPASSSATASASSTAATAAAGKHPGRGVAELEALLGQAQEGLRPRRRQVQPQSGRRPAGLRHLRQSGARLFFFFFLLSIFTYVAFRDELQRYYVAVFYAFVFFFTAHRQK